VIRVADGMSQLARSTSGQLVSGGDHLDTWEQLISKNHLTVWRKPVPNSYLYEYKGQTNPQATNSLLRLPTVLNLSL